MLKKTTTFIAFTMLLFSCQKTNTPATVYRPKIVIKQNGIAIAPTPKTQKIADAFGALIVKDFKLNSNGESRPIKVFAQKDDSPPVGITPEMAPKIPEYDCQCGDGNYIVRGINATGGDVGLFHYAVTFAVSGNKISQFNLFAYGVSAGYDWTTVDTYYNADGCSGTTYGTVKYSVAGFDYTSLYSFKWTVDSAGGGSANITYTWKEIY